MANFLALVAAGIALIYCIQRWINRRRLPYPPGPPGEPIIGNLRQIPEASPWVTYAEWKKKYGDVISFGALGNRIVVVNSAKAVAELFDKRGHNYADRPRNVMINELIKSESMVLMSYNDKVRMGRKALGAALNPGPVVDYIPIQERETYLVLGRLIESPEHFFTHFRRASGAIILKLCYGHSVTTDDDYYVHLANRSMIHLRRCIQPTAFLVNLIPALRFIPGWMPFAGFHRFAKEGREMQDDLREKPFSMVKSQVLAGTAPLSYASKLLECLGSLTGTASEDEFLIKSTATNFYSAGAETSMSPVVTFILAMVLYPEVQKKARAEVDSVVGNSRLPAVSDRDSMPYLHCVMLEVLRWQSVSPMAVPHAAREDDVYEGYLIPKGCAVIGNVWAITHDEELYEEPMKFWPERFDGRFPDIKDPRQWTFGFGRRLCPGRHMAMNSIFIALSCLLAVFDFSKARDSDGNEIEPLVDYTIVGPPQPYLCQITPRSKETVALVNATLATL